MTSVEGTPEGAGDNRDENRAEELVEMIVSRVLAKIQPTLDRLPDPRDASTDTTGKYGTEGSQRL